MLIGFCSGKSTNDQFDDLLPLDEIEGSRVELLSKLITIMKKMKLTVHLFYGGEHPSETKHTQDIDQARRWVADARSGSWLASNVRPLVLVFLTKTPSILPWLYLGIRYKSI